MRRSSLSTRGVKTTADARAVDVVNAFEDELEEAIREIAGAQASLNEAAHESKAGLCCCLMVLPSLLLALAAALTCTSAAREDEENGPGGSAGAACLPDLELDRDRAASHALLARESHEMDAWEWAA